MALENVAGLEELAARLAQESAEAQDLQPQAAESATATSSAGEKWLEFRDILAQVPLTQVPAEQISPDSRLGEDLGWDEIGRWMAVAALERAFKRSVEDAQVTQAQTAGDLAKLWS